MYDRIIVPVDEHGAAASLDLARAVARRLEAELTLLHVHHVIEAPSELEGLPQYRYQHVVERWDGLDAEEEVHEVEWLAEKAAALREQEPGLRVSSRVAHAPLGGRLREDGERVMVIAATAEPEDPGAREIIRAGGVPVLLVPSVGDVAVDDLRHVVVALDGSAFSEEVLDSALELASALHARVSLVEVVSRHSGLARLLHMADRSHEAAATSLRDIRDRLGRRGTIDVRVIEASDVASALVAETEAAEGGVLAMATHGRGGFRRLIWGSVAEGVLGDGRVPVLLIRPTGASALTPSVAATA